MNRSGKVRMTNRGRNVPIVVENFEAKLEWAILIFQTIYKFVSIPLNLPLSLSVYL